MADPQHIPEMDSFDRTGVRLYRAGLCAAALSLWLLAAAFAFGDWQVHARTRTWLWIFYAAATVLSAHHLHIYAKHFRWLIGAAAWTGMLILAAGWGLNYNDWLGRTLEAGGIGFLGVALSAFALKEQFCFKIPLQRLVPVGLIATVILMIAGLQLGVGIALALTAVCYSILAVSKLRMPLHYDIGDKSNYQV